MKTRPKAFLQLAGPDCECIGKSQQKQDCECLGKAKADVAALAKMKTQVENMDIHDLPTMLAMLKSMYGRFEANIKDAAKLEADASVTFQKKEATMTKDLEMNFNKIAPFGKEDTAKELQDHAADTQDTLVDAVENAEVAEIKRAVFRALTRLRAATIKEFDTIARLETQAIDAYNDAHHYRAENPLAHLHEDEAPVETDKLKSSTELHAVLQNASDIVTPPYSMGGELMVQASSCAAFLVP